MVDCRPDKSSSRASVSSTYEATDKLVFHGASVPGFQIWSHRTPDTFFYLCQWLPAVIRATFVNQVFTIWSLQSPFCFPFLHTKSTSVPFHKLCSCKQLITFVNIFWIRRRKMLLIPRKKIHDWPGCVWTKEMSSNSATFRDLWQGDLVYQPSL